MCAWSTIQVREMYILSRVLLAFWNRFACGLCSLDTSAKNVTEPLCLKRIGGLVAFLHGVIIGIAISS